MKRLDKKPSVAKIREAFEAMRKEQEKDRLEHLRRCAAAREQAREEEHEAGMDCMESGWDGHK